ncbi:MAG TPA: DUF4870 domain-containing protein [Pyrinomonadaceae bacterium]|jgi:uncharacterized membrane protein|nr:DUF4870 domain-containing protein [Pyrinomonadaceae bacterium]
METKRSKYDTNPLDPDFVKNAEKDRGDGGKGPVTQPVRRATREVGSAANEEARANIYSETPTRRYDKATLETSYPSVFVPPTYSPPAPYHAAAPVPQLAQRPSSTSVPGLGIPENLATVLPYAPFIGVIASLVELFLVPRSEPKVRFHAAQGLALHVAILVISTAFGVLGAITGSSAGGFLFKLAAFIFLIVSMIRVAKGKPHHISALADPAQWFNDHIELKKS